MFQFKNSISGSDEPSLANKLPNFNGKVRTFKEDSENFKKGTPSQTAVEEDILSSSHVEKNISASQSPAGEQPRQPQPIFPKKEVPKENPFQSMPTPPPLSSPEPDLSALKPSASQSFFSEKPASSENILPPQTDAPPSPRKPKKTIFILLAILLAMIIASAGFYYYWFNIKGATSVAPKTASPETPAPVIPADTPQNNNLRKLIVDTSQSSTAIKDAATTFATDFAATASEGDLIEVKALDKENQPIGKKDFFAGFGITVPDAVAMKLSEDYSLFVKKEGGAVKLGLVFKTITSAGLAEEMKNWEPTMVVDLDSLYLGKTSSESLPSNITFNSSRYKNADIRYFNFSSPANTSLDYSVIANFLVIGTSKDTTRAVLDYMSEK